MKRFLVPIIVLASSLVSAAVIAEVQEIHSDNKPRNCKMTKGKKVKACSAFKFAKIDETYMFLYAFKGDGVVAFRTIPFNQSGDTTGYVFKEFKYGDKDYKVKDLGVCTASNMAKPPRLVRCQADDVDFLYESY